MNNQFTRPIICKDEQQKIGKLMMQILHTRGPKALATAATALGIENARLLAEVNQHRAALGFDPLPVQETRV